MKVNITKQQAAYLLSAVDWAIGDGLHPPSKEESQVIISLQNMIPPNWEYED